jgi:ClpX C4-type zinc finger
MTSVDESTLSVACTFCLKLATDVATMVAGPGVFICDECVSGCVDIIAGKPDVLPPPAKWEQDLSDEDLLAHLPKIASASAQVERQLTAWVGKARARGITWTRIGAALGMTRQSAWERFSGEE